MSTVKKILNAYIQAFKLMFLISGSVLGALLILDFFALTLSDSDYNFDFVLIKIKLLIVLSTVLPIVIITIFMFISTILRLLGNKMDDQHHDEKKGGEPDRSNKQVDEDIGGIK